MSQLFKDMNNDTHIRPHESPQILDTLLDN